ncbi:MAG: CBS domain-containing protein [Chloroflexi bacterium]|nr:CBS domain-containing protein [Chloroflexota bacterium]
MRHYLVRNIMSQPPIVVGWDAPILEASALMESSDIRRLPVVNGNRQVIGIISLGDVREACSVYTITSPYAPEQDEIVLAVDEVMSTPVHTVRTGDDLLVAVRLMLKHKIGGIPVVDEDLRPVGMITESDIFRLLLQMAEEEGTKT